MVPNRYANLDTLSNDTNVSAMLQRVQKIKAASIKGLRRLMGKSKFLKFLPRTILKIKKTRR